MGNFKNYKRAHDFMNPGDDFKKWVDKENYVNHYLEDWNALMELAEECLSHSYIVMYINSEPLEKAILSFNKEKVFKACIKIIKQLNL